MAPVAQLVVLVKVEERIGFQDHTHLGEIVVFIHFESRVDQFRMTEF